jgi:hypothetical protein
MLLCETKKKKKTLQKLKRFIPPKTFLRFESKTKKILKDGQEVTKAKIVHEIGRSKK